MASPIKWFRKYRKESLAILTLFTMLSFVFIPILLQLMPETTRGPRNEVVVTTTKYGKLRENDLAQLVNQRAMVRGFLLRLGQEVRAKGGSGTAVQGFVQAMQTNVPSEEAAVESWLLDHRAAELGLTMTDKTVTEFLEQMSEGKIDSKVVQQILRDMRLSEGTFLHALGQELLAMQLRQMFLLGISGTTPEERYDTFLRLNRAAKIEAIPVAVDKFVDVDQVKEPTDKELREFFDKYKDKPFNPASPDPGFLEPHRIDVQYFKADYEKFLDLKSVSDEEIKDYYEKNKERFQEPELPAPAAPVKPEAGKPEASKPEASTPEAAKPEPGKAEAAKPEAAKPEAKPEAPKTETPKPETPKAEPEKAKPAEKEPGKTSGIERRSPFRLVAFAEEKKVEEKKVEPPAPKADPSAGRTEPAAPKAEASAPKVEAPKADAGASKAPEAKKEEPKKKKEVKYRPLDQVREEIRRELAVQKAQEKVRAVMTRLQDKMIQYQRQWISYDAEVKRNQEATPPTELDFQALAKEAGVGTGQTGLISSLETESLDVGRSAINNTTPFAEYAFGKLALYQPIMSNDLQGNTYLFWKTAETAEKVPDLDDPAVRQRVLQAWKMIEARGPAKQEAQRLADQAQKGKSLKELASAKKGLTLIAPDPFTWMTYGNMPFAWAYNQPPKLGDVKGIDGAGMEFMRAVFRLRPGEAGVAWNQPKTVVYAVRLVEYTPPESTLWENFLKANPQTYMAAGRYDRSVMYLAWQKQIETKAGLDWVRKPQADRGGYSEAE